jgi:hypothetical protein
MREDEDKSQIQLTNEEYDTTSDDEASVTIDPDLQLVSTIPVLVCIESDWLVPQSGHILDHVLDYIFKVIGLSHHLAVNIYLRPGVESTRGFYCHCSRRRLICIVSGKTHKYGFAVFLLKPLRIPSFLWMS